jgi:hypothetical protein
MTHEEKARTLVKDLGLQGLARVTLLTRIATALREAEENGVERGFADGLKSWTDGLKAQGLQPNCGPGAGERGIQAVYPPRGHILTDEGQVRKVLGTLPLTGDGCVVCPGAFVWVMPPHCANPAGFGFRVIELGDSGFINTRPRTETDARWCDTYSTIEAAHAAGGNP